MEDRVKALRRMLMCDGAILWLFYVGCVGISCFTLIQVLRLANGRLLCQVICVIGISCILVLGGAMLWIFLQLQHNESDVYGRELDFRERMKHQKEETHEKI